MTPYEIKILISIHCTPDWIENCGINNETELWTETINKFRSEELLDLYDRGTDKLAAYIGALCNVGMPIQKWVMP